MEDNAIENVVPEAAPAEKMLSQSEVNRIVGREKAQVAERVRREMEAQYKRDLDQPPTKEPAPDNLEDKIFNRLMDKAKEFEELQAKKEQDRLEAEQREQLEKVASQYYLKMGHGKDKYSDFEEVMTDFDAAAFPQVALLAAHLDNTPDIMYELARNPHKLVQLNTLAERSPKLAQRELEKLSKSIVDNQQAVENVKVPGAPLSRIKSSTTVGADNGKMTVRDLKKADWLRG